MHAWIELMGFCGLPSMHTCNQSVRRVCQMKKCIQRAYSNYNADMPEQIKCDFAVYMTLETNAFFALM